MCGRYQFTAEQSAEMISIVQEIDRKNRSGMWSPGEIRPTALAPVLMPGRGKPEADLLTWGFKTSKSLVINARSETAMEKPLFRESVLKYRCIVPSTGFYEWDSSKRKYFFAIPGKKELYMAGLIGFFDGRLCYCILTTAANDSMRETHDRMPLILTKEQMDPWLNDTSAIEEILHIVPPQLERASLEAQTSLW